jgi:thioredoxin reductase (NADPH)
MSNEKAEIILYGATWCPDCKRSKKFLNEQRIPYQFIDIEHDEAAQKTVQDYNNGKQIIPTIILPNGQILVEPSNAQLAQALDIKTMASRHFYDLIVIGGGPAGLTAAIYAAREGIETLVIEKSGLGGQAGITERLDNYPGFADGISGASFAEQLTNQARRFGVELLSAQDIVAIGSCEAMECNIHGEYRMEHWVQTGTGEKYEAKAVLLATGSAYKLLNVPGEEDFIGAGVHFCATCDGPFYKDKPVFVVGGGNSAAEESIFLTRFASQVTLLVRRDSLSASKVIKDKIEMLPNTSVRYNTEIKEFRGKGKLKEVTLVNNQTGETSVEQPAAVFVFVGLEPNTAFLKESAVKLDEHGFIVTSHTLETSMPGVFAAGDVRKGSTKQVASAVGEGATAALMIRQYLQEFADLEDKASIIENDVALV